MGARFEASKDLNGSMLFEKTIINLKGFLSWGNGLRKKFLKGIGISRYNLSGLLNHEKTLVGIAGLENLFEDPLMNLVIPVIVQAVSSYTVPRIITDHIQTEVNEAKTAST